MSERLKKEEDYEEKDHTWSLLMEVGDKLIYKCVRNILFRSFIKNYKHGDDVSILDYAS